MLTQRQRSILDYVAQGYGSKEIALLLGISVNGVKKHVERLLRRYGVSNRPALVMAALVAGDVELHRALGDPARAPAPLEARGALEPSSDQRRTTAVSTRRIPGMSSTVPLSRSTAPLSVIAAVPSGRTASSR